MTTSIDDCSFSSALNNDNRLDGNSFSQELDSFEKSFSEKLANLKKAAHSTCISHRSKSCTDAFYSTPKCSKIIDMTPYVIDENTNPNTSASSIDTYVFRSPNKRIPLKDITKTPKSQSPSKASLDNQKLIETNNKLNERIRKLEIDNKSMKKVINDLNKEKQVIKEELNSIISALNKQIEEIRVEKEKIERMKSIDEYQSNQNILFYTTKLESYERLYSEKENEIYKLNEHNCNLIRQLSEMKEKYNQLDIKYSDNISESNRMIEDLTYQNKSLESKCAALNQMYEDLKKDISNKRNRISRSPRKHYLTKKNKNSTVYETIFDYSPSENSITRKRGSSLMNLDKVEMYIQNIIYFMILIFIYINV